MNPKLESAIASALEAFEKTRRQAPTERAAVLERAANLVAEREAELVQLVIEEAKKPHQLAAAEVARLRMTFKFSAAEAVRNSTELLAVEASEAGKNHRGWTQRVPVGLVLGVTPFNFPLNLVAHKIGPAVASGNVIIIKPSPRTPRAAEVLAAILSEAGAVPGQVQVVNFPHEEVGAVLPDERIKVLSFTGSAAVGWQLKAKAVKQRVTLELGGNAAAVIHSNARWRDRIPLLAEAAFGYAGQSCISVQRLIVQAGIYEEFRAAFLGYVREKVQVGDPGDPEVTVGPMIDSAAKDRVLEWVAEAQHDGGKLLTELRSEGDTLWPIVMENVPPTAKVVAEEVFAPLVVLSKYDDFSEALRQVNASRYGLQAGVFTEDIALAKRAFEQIEAGAVLINQVPTFRVENMPYGGIKDSGFGREGIRYAMEDMTELKTLIVNDG
ncbi:MAG: aldehyde dehydrogenase family protein [Chthoniobacteraceae bacterium]